MAGWKEFPAVGQRAKPPISVSGTHDDLPNVPGSQVFLMPDTAG
jgi:hypothetical protein